jgi:hypothetical protein
LFESGLGNYSSSSSSGGWFVAMRHMVVMIMMVVVVHDEIKVKRGDESVAVE